MWLIRGVKNIVRQSGYYLRNLFRNEMKTVKSFKLCIVIIAQVAELFYEGVKNHKAVHHKKDSLHASLHSVNSEKYMCLHMKI